MRRFLILILPLFLVACEVPAPVTTGPAPVGATAAPGDRLAPDLAVQNFVTVARQVEPVAERYCRARSIGVNCDFEVQYDDRPGQGINAFQTIDRRGRPLIVFTLGLIAEARNVHELAFVMGHEAAHHIEQHIVEQESAARQGAVVFAGIAQAGGGNAAAIQQAAAIGAQVGARRYSQEHELEADALGTEIAFAAGYDPLIGARFFDRLPDPGERILGSHPPNAARQQIVQATVNNLR